MGLLGSGLDGYGQDTGLAPEVTDLNAEDVSSLIFESYFRRGRINYPHYQMSITKSYTAMALGRAIQLGRLTMDDLDKPAISFLKELKPSVLVKGADSITLHQAMHMTSGIRLDKEKAELLRQEPERLKGQGQIQTKTYHCKQGRGAGGQFIFIFPKLELIAVVTAHNKGMGDMLRTLPQRLIPAFDGEH